MLLFLVFLVKVVLNMFACTLYVLLCFERGFDGEREVVAGAGGDREEGLMDVVVVIYRDMLRRPFTLLTKLQIFKAGPSLRPIYFIIISEVNNNKALPSISWKEK